MKSFMQKLSDLLADAALAEMGIEVQSSAAAASVSPVVRFFRSVSDTLADAALLEMGVDAAMVPAFRQRPDRETLEENLIEVAFAEAADYDDIHEAILREHRKEQDIARPDDCGYGDNDLCFV